MIEYIHYTNLATDKSNEIHHPAFWCYFDPHGNTTRMSNIPPKYMENSTERKRMSNDPRTIKKEKKTTPVTITPAKTSLRKITRKVECRYRHWLDTQKLQKWCLKIPEVISEGGEKEYMFQEQQEAKEAEAER